MKKTLILLVFLFFQMNLIFAFDNNNSTISGQIFDSADHSELIGVTVKLNDITVMTDLNGKFKINNLSPGKYMLEISYISFADQKVEISIKENKNKELKIFMRNDDVELEI